MQTIRNNKGFSLVELMVVVAIIGILAAVAIPNFQRFTAKSKQAEAKANLSMYYTAAQAFKQEWGSFTGDMVQMGCQLAGTLNYRISSAAFDGTPATGYTGGFVYAAGNVNTGVAAVCAAGGCVENLSVAGKPGAIAPATAATMTVSTFGAIASGVIVSAGGHDEWQVDQNKNITLVPGQNGLP